MSKTTQKKASKKIWILGVFAIFVAIAMSFVSWLIYAVFEENYREIKQQYYAVVSHQIVEDIENSVKNGKQIERFYGMDNVLSNMLDIVSTDTTKVGAAVTDKNGGILYSSVSTDSNRESYYRMLASENVLSNIAFTTDGVMNYRIVNSGEYEVMIQPVFDKEKQQIGTLTLFYRTEDIKKELLPQKQSSDFATAMCVGATILLLVIYFIALPKSISEDATDSDTVSAYEHKRRQNNFMFIVPVLMIIVGLLLQCVMSYNEYQKRYKDVMFEGATGISSYLGEIIDGLNNKGVPYERMEGLGGYLANKVEESPLLWNVSIVKVFADTSPLLSRDSEYNVSMQIGDNDMFINVEISKSYIDDQMFDMMLVFAVSFVVALIMIYELLKLPDRLFARFSRSFRDSKQEQASGVAPVMRLAAFVVYTGMYVGIPFSSVLITQWNKSIFGLPVTFLASLPMTCELLATMMCSLFLLPVYKRMKLSAVLSISAVISVVANVMCFMVASPEQLIIWRFVAGIGFAGIKYSLNTIAAQGTLKDTDTSNNLAEMNAGLLGGITCGGTLGAVVASSVSVQTAFLIGAVFTVLFLIILLGLTPWKLVYGGDNTAKNNKSKKKEKKAGGLSFLVSPMFLRYVLLVALPMNFGLMFVVSFLPGFVTNLGLPEVTTSYGYLINGLVGIYLGPKMLQALSQKLGRAMCVVISLLLGTVSVLMFNIDLPLVIVLVSVAILGLFDGFGTPATSDYYVNMPVIKQLGVSQGLAVLSVVGSIVQTVSPLLYSVILSAGLLGTNVLGGAFLVCAVLFILTFKLAGDKFLRKEI